MSRLVKSLGAKVFAVAAGMAAVTSLTALAPGVATASEPGAGPPALVHASATNNCKLNVRAAPELTSPTLITLSCANYTTCVNPETLPEEPCGKPVEGGKYSCVGPKNVTVTDNRWVEVAWRAPQVSYVAVSCASFRN